MGISIEPRELWQEPDRKLRHSLQVVLKDLDRGEAIPNMIIEAPRKSVDQTR